MLAMLCVGVWVCFGPAVAQAGKQEWVGSLVPHGSVIRAWDHTGYGGGLGLFEGWIDGYRDKDPLPLLEQASESFFVVCVTLKSVNGAVALLF